MAKPTGKIRKRAPKATKSAGVSIAQKLAAAASAASNNRNRAPPTANNKPKQASAAARGGHIIVLTQRDKNKISTRSWDDYASVGAAMDAIVSSYEGKLKELNPTMTKLSYTVQDVYVYLDSFADISALVYQPKTQQYQPRAKDFIKQSIFNRLKQAVA